jgi:RNA polymerase sigma factor (sigma-70 family)
MDPPDGKASEPQESALLRRYVQDGAQEAFAQLVQQHLSLVYATCLREVRDPDLAQDVTQVVFLVLARKAPALHARTSLAGWLFRTARLASRNALRKERRRMFYEQQAAQQAAQTLPNPYDLWDQIEPLLNEALSALRPPEREAVLLRFFQERSFPEIGAALGLSEDAARMRVSRALDKLRRHFRKHGVVLAAAALPGLLAARAGQAAPAACGAAVRKVIAGVAAGQAPSALAGSALETLTRGVLRTMGMSRVQPAALFACVALIAIGGRARIMANRLPAAGPPVAVVDDSRLENPRLQRKVAITAEGVPVGDLLALLARQTGVTLKADATVADDKVIAFGPARPLRDVMTDLAALFNATWQGYQEGDGEPTYVLRRTVRAREYEEGLANGPAKRMRALLDARADRIEANPETLARRPDEPASASTARRALALYACLSPEQRRLLFADGRMNLTFDMLTPVQQAQLRDVFDALFTEEQEQYRRDRQSIPGLLDTTSKPDDAVKGGLRLGVLLSRGQMIVRIGHHFSMDLTVDDPRAPWLLPPHGNPYNGKKIDGKAALPEVRAVAAAAQQGDWPDVLQKLAEGAGMPLMADYYRSRPIVEPEKEAVLPAGEQTREAVPALDALCRPSGYLWWTRGRTLLFRKRNWYTQRLYEVPDRWMLAMNKRLQASSAQPTYADMLLLSELTPLQMRGLNGIPDRPEGGVIRSAPDEYWLAGVPSLLAILKSSRKTATGPLPVHNPRQPFPPGLLDRFTLHDADCAPGLLQTYLAAQNDLLYAPDYTSFTLYAWRPLDAPQTTADGYRFVPVTLFCGIESRQATFLDFLLPVTLPDDRRDKTRVALAP